MTACETKLWQALSRRELSGVKFRRQHPIGRFTLDFYCPELRIAIEVDGEHHDTASGRRRDIERDAWLASQAILVLRFWTGDVIASLDAVVGKILEEVDARIEGDPLPIPPPFRGRE